MQEDLQTDWSSPHLVILVLSRVWAGTTRLDRSNRRGTADSADAAGQQPGGVAQQEEARVHGILQQVSRARETLRLGAQNRPPWSVYLLDNRPGLEHYAERFLLGSCKHHASPICTFGNVLTFYCLNIKIILWISDKAESRRRRHYNIVVQ